MYTYVTKSRNKTFKAKNVYPGTTSKSNASKRYREKMNTEIERLGNLLPFDSSVIEKLDKLSTVRLAVSYLRVKAYFNDIPQPCFILPSISVLPSSLGKNLVVDAETQMRLLNGFIMIINSSYEVFYITKAVEFYLGFHQSDVLHKSVFELAHSDDREDLWLYFQKSSSSTGDQQSPSRLINLRFRCLLENTSGFITMEMSGHYKEIYNHSYGNKLLFFAMCVLCDPIPSAKLEQDGIVFKTKHALDMSVIKVDKKGKWLLSNINRTTSIYHLLHPDDLDYFASAHREVIRTGSSGMAAYRLLSGDLNYYWLQTSARVVSRNGQPSEIMCSHRLLTELEGYKLLGNRFNGLYEHFKLVNEVLYHTDSLDYAQQKGFWTIQPNVRFPRCLEVNAATNNQESHAQWSTCVELQSNEMAQLLYY